MVNGKRLKARANWIWTNRMLPQKVSPIVRGRRDLLEDTNRFVRFRFSFILNDDAKFCEPLLVSADGRYHLYLDGDLIGRGPGRSHFQRHHVDSYDLQNRTVCKGTHTVSALVHSYGHSTSWYQLPGEEQTTVFGCGGFFLQGAIGDEQIDSGVSWKCAEANEWSRESPLGGTGFMEYVVLPAREDGWKLPAYDDSLWEQSQELRIRQSGRTDAVPFPQMVVSVTKRLEEREVRPKEILDHSDRVTVVFSELVVGRAKFVIETACAITVIIRLAERMSSDGHIHVAPEVPGISANIEHRFTLSVGENSFALFEPAGFRCLEVSGETSDCCDMPWFSLRDVAVDAISYPVEDCGAFSCDDSRLVDIWDAGARTVHKCIMDAYVDCPTREQRTWVGDVYVSALVGYRALGVTEPALKYLHDVAMTQRADGMVLMAAACDLADHEYSFIPDFALLWVLAWHQYMLHTGDLSVLHSLGPSILKLLAWFEPYLNDDGLLEDVTGWVFFEWADPLERTGVLSGLNALYAAALRVTTEWISDAALPDWRAVAAAVNASFWDDDRGAYLDSLNGQVISQQTNSLILFFGLAPEHRSERVITAITDPATLAITRVWGWDETERPFDAGRNVVAAQPFYAHFLHGALYQTKRAGLLYGSLLRWHAMLSEFDTFWESWDLTSISSTCHGFSATPTYDLSAYLLGVTPVEPGFRTTRVSPLVPPGVNRINGDVPTPLGILSVVIEIQDDGCELTIRVPSGMRVLVAERSYTGGENGSEIKVPYASPWS